MMNRLSFLLLFLPFSFFPCCLISQRPGYHLYTVADGLVQSEVIYIHQDKKGLLWIGTKNGISRFDGRHFQTIADSNMVSTGPTRFISDLDDSAVFVVTSKGYMLYEYGRTRDRITSGKLQGGLGGHWVQQGKGFIVVKYDSTGAFLKWTERV